jgi:hypothetical protein
VLAVDWVPSRPWHPEGLIMVYDGGVLNVRSLSHPIASAIAVTAST